MSADYLGVLLVGDLVGLLGVGIFMYGLIKAGGLVVTRLLVSVPHRGDQHGRSWVWSFRWIGFGLAGVGIGGFIDVVGRRQGDSDMAMLALSFAGFAIAAWAPQAREILDGRKSMRRAKRAEEREVREA